MRTIRLLLVDDHPVVRNGLRMVVEIDPSLEIVGEAATVATALARIEELSPDVVLLDVRLAGEDGLEVCRRAKEGPSKVRVLCLTSYADDDLVLSAIEAGADGYLLKQNDAERIAEAVHAVMEGKSIFDPVVAPVTKAGPKQSEERQRMNSLAPSERRVLAEVAKGRTDKEVAVVLNLSVKTVRNSLDRVFRKLGVHTRTGAALAWERRKE